MTPFHNIIMDRLDRAQKSGKLMTPLHSQIRAALRAANMKGVQFETPEALAKAVAAKAWGLGRELRQKTA